ncbi:MAG: hypothetical protein Q7I89_09270 [Syntrophales bacterium]|nr:hypothetical protein [Syntrophales bacterium]
MALPTYKDIVELLKKGATVEAQEQIMALREGALLLQEENFGLREKVKNLEESLRIKGQLTFDGSSYWLYDGSKADGPFCQHCYDTSGKLVRLQDWGERWSCFACKNYPEKKRR